MRCEPISPRTVTRIDWAELRDEFPTRQNARDQERKKTQDNDFKDLFEAEVKRLNSQPERRI